MPKPKAAIYARLSQDRDGTKTGTDRHVADCRRLARREGLTVAWEYVDNDHSAYNDAWTVQTDPRGCTPTGI